MGGVICASPSSESVPMMRPAVRLLASACAAALLFGATPGLAQVGTPALDRVLAPIPAPRDVAYPGVITLAAALIRAVRRQHDAAFRRRCEQATTTTAV